VAEVLQELLETQFTTYTGGTYQR